MREKHKLLAKFFILMSGINEKKDGSAIFNAEM